MVGGRCASQCSTISSRAPSSASARRARAKGKHVCSRKGRSRGRVRRRERLEWVSCASVRRASRCTGGPEQIAKLDAMQAEGSLGCFLLTETQARARRFAVRYLLLTQLFPVRFGRSRVPTTRTVLWLSRTLSVVQSPTPSQPISNTNGIENRYRGLDARFSKRERSVSLAGPFLRER